MENIKIGKAGEALAEIMLNGKGYSIIERNYSCRYGEVDIIATKGKELAFVEVKTRFSDKYGSGREAVTFSKRMHIRNCAEYYLETHMCSYDAVDFQVVEINLEHLQNLEF